MEIRLLGPFEALHDGDPLPGFTGRVRSLLAILAIAVPDTVSVDAIGERLWGEQPPAHLRGSVQTLVTRLRTLLAPLASVDRTDGGYALRIGPDQVDVLRFTRLIESATGPTERDQLAAALALWRGEPFAGIRSDWLQHTQAPRLVEAYLSAVERRLDLDLAAGDHESVLPELRELTARHPLRESLWRRLLTALSLSGRPAEALALYDQLRRRLADELGVDPEPALRRLHAELLAAAESQAAPPPRTAPRQLPPAPARFTGRTTDLAQLDALATDSTGVPIIAIHGPGGVGKTSLALHWAHHVSGRFPDGQLYLNLQGYGPGEPVRPETALDLLLRGLGVSGANLPDTVPARTAMLRTLLADRRVLLLLDNARDAEQVRPLLPGAGGLVLVTSRSQLRSLAAREGAHRLPLHPFSTEDAATYLLRSFQPHDVHADTPELAELAGLCDYLPLALAIAAERVTREPTAGLQVLTEELRRHPDRLKVLDVGEDDDGALRVVFDWSYEVLAAEQARTFRLLGLAPAPDLGLAATAALTAVPVADAGRTLDHLVSAHLVEQRPGDRYQLHDLLRIYSASLAQQVEDAAELDAARTRLFDWYAHSALNAKNMLERADSLLDFGPPAPGVVPVTFDDVASAAQWFARERHVIVAAVSDAARHGHDRAAYRLTFALRPYLVYLRALDDIFATQQVAMEAARRTGDVAGEAATAHNFGRAYLQRPDLPRAFKYFEHALRLFEVAGDERGRGWVLTDVGRLYRRWGDPHAAIRHHLQAIETLSRFDDPVEEARNLAGLAETYLTVGRTRDAVDAAERAVAIHRRTGEQRSEAFALDTLGTAWLAHGDQPAAVRFYQQSLELARALDDRWSEVSTLANLGHAHHRAGDAAQARSCWQRALDIFIETGLPGSSTLDPAVLRDLLAGT